MKQGRGGEVDDEEGGQPRLRPPVRGFGGRRRFIYPQPGKNRGNKKEPCEESKNSHLSKNFKVAPVEVGGGNFFFENRAVDGYGVAKTSAEDGLLFNFVYNFWQK